MTESVNTVHSWETTLYSFVNSFPFMLLVLYSFRGHWRFGKKVTYILVGAILVFQVTFTQLELYIPFFNHSLSNIVRSVSYIVFIFLVLKEHPGKLTFTVLVVSNLGAFSVFCGGRSKAAEGTPELSDDIMGFASSYTRTS